MLIVKQPHHTKSGGVCFIKNLKGGSFLVREDTNQGVSWQCGFIN
jgi:hypothetical protein